MNSLLSKLFVAVARKQLQSKEKNKFVSKKQIVPLVRKFQIEISHAIKEYFFIAIGVFSAGFGLNGFLLPNRFIDGATRGISLLLQNITKDIIYTVVTRLELAKLET